MHEGEDTGPGVLRFLDHDADPETHVGLGEVDDALAFGVDRQRGDGDVGLLYRGMSIVGERERNNDSL